MVLALLMAAGCGVKPSAIHDRAASPRLAPQDLDFNNETPGTGLPTPVEQVTSTPEPTQPPASGGADSSRSANGGAAVLGPPAPARAAAASAGPAPRPLTSNGAAPTPASEPRAAPAPAAAQSGPAAGPPAPAPPPPPGPSGPAPAPAPPPRSAFDGEPDRTGVTDKTIRIGIHAPVTGAAPFPQRAFELSNDLYWKWLADKGGVNGRNVEVVFRDDKYNPSSAVQACREMIEKEKVFLIIGFAGTDQIGACARYADSVGVPYFSGGVNEDSLSSLNRYFAISQTYDQQSATLVKLMQKRIRKTKVAIVVIATPALNNTVRSITNEVQKAPDLKIVRSSRIGKYASDAELLSEAQQLRNSGAEVVYVIAAPIPFIKLAANSQAQGFNPTWVGPGTTVGFRVVAEAGCPAIGDSKFLSPFPQLDAIDDLDPNYRPAYRRYVGDNPDDIGILNWGMNKTIHQMLEATGRDLSRQSFLKTVTSGQVFHSNVYPDVSYDGTTRFGAHTAHLLESDCSAREWKTTRRFAAAADF